MRNKREIEYKLFSFHPLTEQELQELVVELATNSEGYDFSIIEALLKRGDPDNDYKIEVAKGGLPARPRDLQIPDMVWHRPKGSWEVNPRLYFKEKLHHLFSAVAQSCGTPVDKYFYEIREIIVEELWKYFLSERNNLITMTEEQIKEHFLKKIYYELFKRIIPIKS